MMDTGMNVARLNFSHGSHEYHAETIKNIRTAVANYSKKIGMTYPLAIALDTKGPEIQLFQKFVHELSLKRGNLVSLTVNTGYKELVTENMIYVDYPNLIELTQPEDTVYVNNGNIRLLVIKIVGDEVKCSVEISGKLTSKCNIRFPCIPVDVPEITDDDLTDIKFTIDKKIDVLLVPGMKRRESIKKLKDFLGSRRSLLYPRNYFIFIGSEGQQIMIVSKIDSFQSLSNIQGIVDESDGIVINRTALAIDIPEEKLFLAQKSIAGYCNKVGKPVICSSQILESLILAGAQPTNSEICDIANAVMDGIDGFILSRETSMGEDPVAAISKLSSICREAEAAVYQKQVFLELSDAPLPPLEPIYSLAISAVQISLKCNAAAIIVLTASGRSAKVIAKFRPRPIHYCWCKDSQDRLQFGITWGKLNGFIRVGDAIVILAAARPGAGFTNFIQIVYATEFDTIPV
ncbi:hypothetical protein RI129_000872 [Pyrocoelia pectoralis]|uniref:Pyruvate kinase n=1 Tax=Pyrocoelia pectoralis TaxID=417401 RepID=A0AAN7VV74_9COLE